MPRYAIIGVIQLLCLQNESIQRDKYDKFPMHLKNDASFPSGNRHDGTEAITREKNESGLCLRSDWQLQLETDLESDGDHGGGWRYTSIKCSHTFSQVPTVIISPFTQFTDRAEM